MAFSSLEQFFAALRTQQTPALLWYSQPGERIELSGRVLDNWVSKTSNFLVDECEVEAGDTVTLALETHWRSLVIALAALRVGAEVQLVEQSEDVASAATRGEVCFSFTPQALENLEIDYPVVVDRGPLSPRYMGELPQGATDYCAEVRAHGDVYSQFETPELEQSVFTGQNLNFEALLAETETIAQAAKNFSEAPSLRLEEPQFLTADYLSAVLGVLAAGRGVVVLDPSIEWSTERTQMTFSDEKAEIFAGQSH